MYMCVYICVYVYLCICVYACVLCIYVYVCMYLCVCMYMYMCVYVHIYVCTCVCMYVARSEIKSEYSNFSRFLKGFFFFLLFWTLRACLEVIVKEGIYFMEHWARSGPPAYLARSTEPALSSNRCHSQIVFTFHYG